MKWDERMIDALIYCVAHEVSIYLVFDMPQASTSPFLRRFSRVTSIKRAHH
jgi:hypothetical protein